MKTHETALYRYIPVGKDVWGTPVYAAYLKLPGGEEQFAGYWYRRTKKDFARLRKLYGSSTLFSPWAPCPEHLLETKLEWGE